MLFSMHSTAYDATPKERVAIMRTTNPQKDRADDCLTYRAEEAFRRIGVGRSTGYKLIREGTLPAIRLGKLLLVPRHAIEKLIGR